MATAGILSVDNLEWVNGGTTFCKMQATADVVTFSGDGAALVELKGVAEPTANTSATTKQYVDALTAGLHWKDACVTVSDAAGTLASDFENNDIVGGYTVSTGDRILIKDQASGAENGIYVVAASGAPTRASDLANEADATGAAIFISDGDCTGCAFVCTNAAGLDLVGTDALVFTQFSALDSTAAGAGLTKTGTTLSVNVDDSTVEISSNNLRVKDSGVTNAKLANDSVTVTAGDGLQTGGSVALGAAVTVDVDSTVIRTTGAQSLAGIKTHTDVITMGSGGTDWDVPVARGTSGQVLVEDGTGTPVWGDVVSPITAGDGVDVTAEVVAVDATVVRTTGAQSLAGIKTHTDVITMGSGGTDWDVPIARGTSGQVLVEDGTGTPVWGDVVSPITAGDGVDVTAEVVAVDATVIRTTGAQSLAGIKTHTDVITMGSGGTDWDVPIARGTSGQVLVEDGTGTPVWGDVVSPLTAGDGVDITAEVVAVDATVVRTTGAQSISGIKTFGANVEIDHPFLQSSTLKFQEASATVMEIFSGSASKIEMRDAESTVLYTATKGDTGSSLLPEMKFEGDVVSLEPLTMGTGGTAWEVPNTRGTVGQVLIADGSGTPAWGAVATPLTAGDGVDITGGIVAVDSTVIRTTGAQSLAGVKTHTDVITMGSGGTDWDVPIARGTTGQVLVEDGTGTPAWGAVVSPLTAGDGVDITGGIVAVDSTVVRTSGAQTIADIKTLSSQLRLSATSNQLRLGFGNVMTITATPSGGSPTYTIPVFAGVTNSNFVMSSGTQSIAGLKTFTGVTTLTASNPSTTTSTGALVVTGGVGVGGTVTATAINAVSDERKKKEIVSISSEHAQKLMDVRMVQYKWKNDQDLYMHAGVVAQEVEKVLPECVRKSNDEYSIEYQYLFSMLLKSHQDLVHKHELLLKRVEALEQ